MIVCSAELDDTFSLDGLIVAKSIYFEGINEINISLKKEMLSEKH